MGGDALLVISIRLYVAPLPQAQAALVIPDAALADLRDAGYLFTREPAPLLVEVVAPEPPSGPLADGRAVAQVALPLVRRAAFAATLPAVHQPVGPQGRWYGALLTWGWLLLLAAAQNALQVLGGLWLVAGLPWARGSYRRITVGLAGLSARALTPALETAQVRLVQHAGLSRLPAILEEAGEERARALRDAAGLAAAAGAPGLQLFYEALAAGRVPPGVWAML
jgi:hypothetical protein